MVRRCSHLLCEGGRVPTMAFPRRAEHRLDHPVRLPTHASFFVVDRNACVTVAGYELRLLRAVSVVKNLSKHA